jgi:hypothetical protein
MTEAIAVSTFACPAHVIEFCLKVLREKTGGRAPLDFPCFVHRLYTISPGRLNRKHITLTLQWIEASKLMDNSNKLSRQNASFSKN